MFSDEMRPGRTFWRDDIFDPTQTADGPFYNVPGYLDNFKGTKKAWRTPLFRFASVHLVMMSEPHQG